MCRDIFINLFLFPFQFPLLPKIEIETNNDSSLNNKYIQT